MKVKKRIELSPEEAKRLDEARDKCIERQGAALAAREQDKGTAKAAYDRAVALADTTYLNDMDKSQRYLRREEFATLENCRIRLKDFHPENLAFERDSKGKDQNGQDLLGGPLGLTFETDEPGSPEATKAPPPAPAPPSPKA